MKRRTSDDVIQEMFSLAWDKDHFHQLEDCELMVRLAIEYARKEGYRKYRLVDRVLPCPYCGELVEIRLHRKNMRGDLGGTRSDRKKKD